MLIAAKCSMLFAHSVLSLACAGTGAHGPHAARVTGANLSMNLSRGRPRRRLARGVQGAPRPHVGSGEASCERGTSRVSYLYSFEHLFEVQIAAGATTEASGGRSGSRPQHILFLQNLKTSDIRPSAERCKRSGGFTGRPQGLSVIFVRGSPEARYIYIRQGVPRNRSGPMGPRGYLHSVPVPSFNIRKPPKGVGFLP